MDYPTSIFPSGLHKANVCAAGCKCSERNVVADGTTPAGVSWPKADLLAGTPYNTFEQQTVQKHS
eukprot:4494300-Amphidinium_carterae.2